MCITNEQQLLDILKLTESQKVSLIQQLNVDIEELKRKMANTQERLLLKEEAYERRGVIICNLRKENKKSLRTVSLNFRSALTTSATI